MSRDDESVNLDEARAYVESVWERFLADLAELVSVPSVVDVSDARPGASWGGACRDALDCALGIGARLGLRVADGEGHMGWAELPGREGAPFVSAVAHVDVVPAGSGWHTNPFHLERRDGFLLGRGVLDDKGAAVAMLYAAAFFAGRGAPGGVGLRYLLGASEEAGMQDVRWYRGNCEQPLFCFVPDASFPVCCGEKGGVNARFAYRRHGDAGRILSIEGGTARNAVPDRAVAEVLAGSEAPSAEKGVETEFLGGERWRVTARGTGGHAAMPEGTVNAVGVLVSYLLRWGICSESERAFLELESLLLSHTDGSGLGIDADDDLFDPLTCVGTKVSAEGDAFVQELDIRFPESTTVERIGDRLVEVASRFGCEAEVTHTRVPYLVDPAEPEVQALLGVYEEVTGKEAAPFTIGGGTYAHHFDRAVGFGPLDPREVLPDWVGPEHGANEGISEAALKRAMTAYVLAFDRLLRMHGAGDEASVN